jgi:RHS repeat-associated protein
LYYIRRDGEWTHIESTLPASYPLANTFADENDQPNPAVQLADMNGDRMLDLVCLIPESSGFGQRITVKFWPVCGLGRYADERTMLTSVPDSFEIGAADLRDVLIDDFTGDGLADVIVLDSDGSTTTLTLRVNIGGLRWSPPFVRSNLPRYQPRVASNPTVLRFADMNANGSVDLLFRNTAPQDEWTYVELMPAGKPSLLSGIDNSLGKYTTIVYDSAAEDERLARESGQPWRTYAPIALQVVRQIRTSCGLDLNGDGQIDSAVAEFRYRDPYYDGFEREFRGFAFAQRVDYGDDYLFEELTGLMKVSAGWDNAKTPTGQVSGPSLVSRYRFHTGAADQRDNDDYGGVLPPLRLTDELTIRGGREEEPLKGLQWIEEKVDPVVLHSALDGGFDAGALAASLAVTATGQAQITPDAYVYTRSWQEWTVRRLYRPAEALPYLADQNADGVMEDYRTAPLAPIPEGRFARQGIVVMPGDGRSVSFAYASNVVTEFREANGLLNQTLGYPIQGHLRTVRAFNFDDYGNQTEVWDFGIDDPAYDDERFVTTSYAHGGNALGLWIIDKPDTISTTDENGVFVAKKVHYYDGLPFVGLRGQIESRALLSRTEEYIDADRSIQSARARFDPYGNIDETRDPVGNIRRIAWDPVFKTFPVTETIVIGGGLPDLVINAAYDYGFGVVTSSEDFNGNLTTYHYDSFARLVEIVRPGDTAALPTLAFSYQPADPIRGRAFRYDTDGDLTLIAVPLGSSSRVTTRQREIGGQPGEVVSATFTDGCGKPLATIEEGQVAGTWIVRKATSYNLRLQPQADWLPYQISSTEVPQFPAIWPSGRPPQTDGVNPAIVSTDTYHDPVGRAIRTVSAPETWAGSRRESATQYLPFRKQLFDEEDLRSGSPHFDTPHIQFSDGLNRLIAVEEVVRITDAGLPGPLTNWRTSYTYDLNDQLIRIQDSQGNIKTMAFDALKRMTNMNDPDRGRMTFVYDDASNLRETIDAKAQRIVYTYDGANRIRTEDYQDGGPRVFDVEFFYDAAQSGLDVGDGTTGIGRNTKGQIAFVRDLSGETHFSYDERARIEWEVKRVTDRLHGQLVSFRTRYGYDSADRLGLLTYPDGDQVLHSYNARSLLTRIHGSSLGDVIASVIYRPSGQILNTRYGNGVGTAYAYDPRLRLTSLETTNSQNIRLIDFAYTFDGASNIDLIEDQRNLTGLPDAAKRFNTQVFSYDSLYRLVRASYPVFGGSSSNHVTYRYDRIGNMLAQTSDIAQEENGLPVTNLGEMESGGAAGRFNRNGRNANDPPGPHALTAIRNSQFATRNYPYDANGNMLNIDGLACTWDFKDRLVAVENNEMRAAYSYDYTDRRITKTVHWKNPTPDKGSQVSTLNPAWRSTATHYINRYFEMREHDALVKYVWNGPTRVARVTATLGTPMLVQHLRLQQGWNHVALRVGGQFPVLSPANNSDIGACTWFSGGTADNGFTEVTASTDVPAGATLWVYAERDTTVILNGVPASQAMSMVTGNSQFIGNVLAEPLAVSAVFPANAWLKLFDTEANRWRNRFPFAHELAPLNDASMFVLPGEAAWTTSGMSGPFGTNLAALRVRYYHQDCLGSTTVTTGQGGSLVEEISNYAFGIARHLHKPENITEPYSFTQKERDSESGFHYFEARYFATSIARFNRTDPLVLVIPPPRENLLLPQRLNAYSYCRNRPHSCVDPTGRQDESSSSPQEAPASDAPAPNQGGSQVPAPAISLNVSHVQQQPAQCHQAAVSMASQTGATPAGHAQRIDTRTQEGTQEGIQTIDSELASGRAVVARVDRHRGNTREAYSRGNSEETGQHAVTITGRTANGCYTFDDPGTQYPSSAVGTLCVNPSTGRLEGNRPYNNPQGNVTYSVTNVRPNAVPPPLPTAAQSNTTPSQ